MKTIRLYRDQALAFLISLLFAATCLLFLFLFRISHRIPVQELFTTSCPIINLESYTEATEPANVSQNVTGSKTIQQGQKNNTADNEVSVPAENPLLTNYSHSAAHSTGRNGIFPSDEPTSATSPFLGMDPTVPGDNMISDEVNLAGRTVINLAKANGTNESGIVVVNIVVNDGGTVVSAEPSGRGTTTSSSILRTKACEAAFHSSFSPAPGKEDQKGSIRYVFEF